MTMNQTIPFNEIETKSNPIGYWVLAHQSWNIFKKPDYFCLPYHDDHKSSTTDPKRAMRWFHYEEAAWFAEGLKGTWAPIYVVFDGDELAYIKS